jgi:mannose-6-phosphate isomerase-like protein (cupin superfamily)
VSSAPKPSVAAGTWTVDEVIETAREALASGCHPRGRVVNGRINAILAAPADDSSTDIALGFSAIPAGTSTEAHTHRAEEIALVVSGTGEVDIDGRVIPLEVGSLILAPAWSSHRTTATGTTPLVSIWVYAPTGSEARWLPDRPAPETGGEPASEGGEP